MGDTGVLTGPGGAVAVADAQRPVPGLVTHRGEVTAGEIAVGDVVEVKNCSDGTFNGTFTITAKSSTTISFAKTHANVSSASATGTVTNGVAAPVGTMMITLQPSY